MKKISVIIPCYNVSAYLESCLSSLAAQTIGLDAMELIFVDDASTDGTREILYSIEQRYPDSVKVICLDENGKQGRARNIGIAYAEGKYIGFMDADDQILPQMYEELYQKAEETESDLVSSYVRHTNSLQQRPRGRFAPESRDAVYPIDTEQKRRYLLAGGMGIYGTVNVISKLYRHDFLESFHIRFGEKYAFEDLYFSDMVSFYVSRFCVMQAEYYCYLEHPGSTMTGMDNEKWLKNRSIMKDWAEDCKERGLLEKYEQEIAFIFARDYYVSNLHHFFLSGEEDVSGYVISCLGIMEELFPDIQKNPYVVQPGEEYLYEYQKDLFSLAGQAPGKGKIQVLRRKYCRRLAERYSG